MKEKLTDRIGIISFYLYAILFYAQVICLCYNVDFMIKITLFVIYNLCIGTVMIIYLPDENKKNRLLKTILVIFIADAFLVMVCLAVYGIKMIL